MARESPDLFRDSLGVKMQDPRYAQITAGDFLTERLREIGLAQARPPLSRLALKGVVAHGRQRGGQAMKLFISYRRSDSQVESRLLRRCAAAFVGNPQRDIFMDVHSIPPGVDFPDYIDQMLTEGDVVLVVIGPQWLDARDDQGHRRLDKPDDFVRIEVATALRRGLRVVPLLLDGAAIPPASALPPDLAQLPDRSGARLRQDSLEADMESVLAGLGLTNRNPNRRVLLGAGAAAVAAVGAAAASWRFQWPSGLYPDPPVPMPPNVLLRVQEARARAAQAAAATEAAKAARVEADSAKARAEREGDSESFEFSEVPIDVGRYRGQRRAPGVQAVGVFERVGGDSYAGRWLGFDFEGEGVVLGDEADPIETCHGRFTANVLTGVGELSFKDGSIYRGEVGGRAPRGLGVLAGADGERVGAFIDGKLHGLGALFAPDGSVVHAGRWRNGEFIELPADQPAAQARADAPAPSAIAANDRWQALEDQAREAERTALDIAERGRQSASLAQQSADDAHRLIPTPGDFFDERATATLPGGLVLQHAVYSDGSVYAGQFRAAQGALGIYTSASACCVGDTYAGAFDPLQGGGHFAGYGVYRFGEALAVSPSSSMAEQAGRFVESKQQQFGEILYRDGRRYCGAIADDAPAGLGVLYRPDGAVLFGAFAGPVLQGEGVEYPAQNAPPRRGRWEAGVLLQAE